jgi:hypothetical protein
MNKKIVTVLFFITVFSLYFLPPIDTDFGWHYRYGNYFLNHGRPLMKNSLNVLLNNQSWPNSYTFYQPLIALTYNLFSFWGLSFLNSLIFLITFIFIWRLTKKNLLKTFFIAVLTTLGGWSILRYGLRGQMFSLLFLGLLFFVLQKVNQFILKFIYLFLIFFFWANFHGSYFLGLLLALTWIGTKFFFTLIDQQPDWKQISLGLPVLFAPLINPYGIGNYTYVLKTMRSPLNKMIAEWVPPILNIKLIVIFLFLFYLILLVQNLSKKKVKNNLFWFLATLMSVYLVFKARRNLPQFFLIQALALARIIPVSKISQQLNQQTKNFLMGIILGTSLLLSLIILTPQTIAINSSWKNYCREGMTKYPCQAVDYIQQNNIQGNIYNYYRWGGFLVWQLPESKIFVDGHIPGRQLPSGKYPYQLHLEILQAQKGFQQMLDQYKIDYILIPPNTYLDLELIDNQDAPWQEMYRDETAVMYKKS